MINIVIGCVLGIIFTSVGFTVIKFSDLNLTIQTITNIIIALATFIAVAINYLSIKNQKDSRRWEVNKEILINVSTTLSDLLSQTEKLVDVEFNSMQGIPEEQKFTPDNSIYKKFDRFLNHTIEIYSPILNKEIIEAINAYKKTDEGIDHGINIGAMSLFEAYDASFGAQKKLQNVLSENIKKYASI